MRVTFGTKYNQMLNNNGHITSNLNDLNTKIASGKKIQYGWQDASVSNQNLKLEYDEVTLQQGIDVAKTAEVQTLAGNVSGYGPIQAEINICRK